MKVILRYFYNPKTGKLVTSVGGLAFALKHKCEVKNVVHSQSVTGWGSAVTDSANVLKSRLLASFWGNCFTVIWALLVVALLWWLPIGLPIKWGWPAFLVLIALPSIVMALTFHGAIWALILGRRLSHVLDSIIGVGAVMASPMACPTMLLSEQKEKPVKKWAALISLVLLLAFMSARVAIPLRGFAVIVHDIEGNEFPTEEVYQLAPDEYWEYAPRFIRGTAYGTLYYDEGTEILVLSMDYILENSKHRSSKPVKDQIQIWMSNVAYYYSMTIKGEGMIDLDREEMVWEIREGIESEPVQAALHKTFKEAADKELGERYTTLEFEVKWISVDEYIKKVK
jgi:hypothetical protein